MMLVARGVASIVTDGGQTVGFPDWFTNLAIVRNFGFTQSLAKQVANEGITVNAIRPGIIDTGK